jgi:transcriptional regulator with XRE-family HTH domain
MATEDRKPNPVDLHVGARIRLRRKTIGISQEQLSYALGLTFQQVQKYENGQNRVSASKLWDIARKLEVGVEWFFEGLESDTPSTQKSGVGNPALDLVGASGGLEVAQGYLSAPQQGRVAMLAIARAFSGATPAQAA